MTASGTTASPDASSGPSAPPPGYTSAEGDTGGDGSPKEGPSSNFGATSTVASSVTTPEAPADVKNSGNTANASFLSPTDAAAHGISTTITPASDPSVPSYLEVPPVHDGDNNIHLVGVPATLRHLESGAFTRDGYGGLEVLMPVESLTTREKAALNDCVGDHVDLRTRILTPRVAPLESTDLEAFWTESQSVVKLHVSYQNLDTSDSRNEYLERSRRFGRSSRETFERRRSYRQVTWRFKVSSKSTRSSHSSSATTSHWDQRLFKAGIKKEAALQDARDDIRHLMEEHDRDNRGLRKQVKNLSEQLEDARIQIRLLEERLRTSGFSPIDLMNFLGGGQGGSVNNAHWQHLLDLLVHFKDGSAVGPAWRTMITVIAADDPSLVSTPFVSLSRPRDPDGEESKQSEPPRHLDLTRTHTSTPSNTSSSKRKRPSGSPKYKKHRRAPDTIQSRPSDWIKHSSHDCRTDKCLSVQAKQQALTSLTDYPVTWDDLRLDLQSLMLSGAQYPDALEWLSDDREAHVTFRLGALV